VTTTKTARAIAVDVDRKLVASTRLTNELRKQAFDLEIWEDFGFASWTEYCVDRKIDTRVPRAEVAEAARDLSNHGLTQRQVGEALGIGKGTVHRSTREEGEPNSGAPSGAASLGQPKSEPVIDAPMVSPTCKPKVIRPHILDQLQAWERETLALANSGLTEDEVRILAESMYQIYNAITRKGGK
jgi:hypothetical protein